MTTLFEFSRLGFHHIVNPAAIDHILFLVALVAGYRWRDWRHLLGVVTAFTIGHSITLAGVATGTLQLPSRWIEFLIPVTIVITGAVNLRALGTRPSGMTGPILAATFGLIHGAGFANYLAEMFSGPVLVPLLGFNLGIEAGQLVLLGTGLALLSGFDRLVTVGGGRPAIRAATTSIAAAGWALVMAVERWPG